METNTQRIHIEKRPGVCGGRPCIAGTRIRVQDIYVWHELQGQSPAEIQAAFPHISIADVHSALAYYFDNVDEIRQDIKEAEEFVAAMRASQPSLLEAKLAQVHGNGNPVSPG